MNQFHPAKNLSVGRASILTIGSYNSSETNLPHLKSNSLFQWRKLPTLQNANFWLSAEQREKPLMVFADYNLLAADDFRWVRAFRLRKAMQYVPVILLNCPRQMDLKKVLLVGIDDCYEGVPEWSYLVTRGRQLQRVRSALERPTPSRFNQINRQNAWQTSKRILDVIAASLLLLLSLPVCLMIALLIKLESRGPVIYRSKRAGQNYRVFNFLKFRSMYVDADKKLKELQHLNQYKVCEQPAFVKIKNDPRITKVGRFIRKTSLDELPQLVNVLKGDMSLVGNRPLPLYEATQLCKEETAERFAAPAGITGLWQVTKRGRDEMSASERINLDIEYARKSSFWFDLKIIFRTLPAMVQHENV